MFVEAHLDSQVRQLGQDILEEVTLWEGEFGGQHHAHVVAGRGSHQIREHVDSCVTQQDWRVSGHEGVKPVTHLK